MSERLRLFVATDLPADVRAQLAAWGERVAPDGVRAVPEANLHLTLAFLGTREPADAETVAGLLTGVARPVGELTTAAALWLPPRRPRVLTVALAACPALARLQADIVEALADALAWEPERRAFRAHVTVGRVRRGMRVRGVEVAPPLALTFASPALTLYRSRPGPGGARYEPLARAALG